MEDMRVLQVFYRVKKSVSGKAFQEKRFNESVSKSGVKALPETNFLKRLS
jgi:hypothetical protein